MEKKMENEMVVSQNSGPQYRPQYTIVLLMGTPKLVPLIWGNPHMETGNKMGLVEGWGIQTWDALHG